MSQSSPKTVISAQELVTVLRVLLDNAEQVKKSTNFAPDVMLSATIPLEVQEVLCAVAHMAAPKKEKKELPKIMKKKEEVKNFISSHLRQRMLIYVLIYSRLDSNELLEREIKAPVTPSKDAGPAVLTYVSKTSPTKDTEQKTESSERTTRAKDGTLPRRHLSEDIADEKDVKRAARKSRSEKTGADIFADIFDNYRIEDMAYFAIDPTDDKKLRNLLSLDTFDPHAVNGLEMHMNELFTNDPLRATEIVDITVNLEDQNNTHLVRNLAIQGKAIDFVFKDFTARGKVYQKFVQDYPKLTPTIDNFLEHHATRLNKTAAYDYIKTSQFLMQYPEFMYTSAPPKYFTRLNRGKLSSYLNTSEGQEQYMELKRDVRRIFGDVRVYF